MAIAEFGLMTFGLVQAKGHNKVLILIPAHNEAAVIAQTVATVKDYLTESDQLIVIDDGSTDDTAALAERAGAQVVRRPSAERLRPTSAGGKGEALRWWATQPAAQTFTPDSTTPSGVIILDADTRLAPDFLALMRAHLMSGTLAAQGFIQPIGTQTPAAEAAAFSTLLEQQVDDRLRASLSWPVRIRGTGFMLRADLLADMLPHLRTQVEDVELSLLLAQRGTQVVFVPEAIVFDPLPATVALAANQRARWLRGQAAVWRLYWPLIVKLLGRGPWAWSLLSSLLLKPRSLLLALKVVLMLSALGLAAVWPPLLGLSALAALSLAVEGLYFVVGWLLLARSNRKSPGTLIGFLILWLRSLRLALMRTPGWLRAR